MVITGSGFQVGATVTFGGSAATAIVVASATSITCLTPAHAAGAVDVKVTNPDGGSATLTNGFLYLPHTWADTPLTHFSSPVKATDLEPHTHLVQQATTPGPTSRLISTPLPPLLIEVTGMDGPSLDLATGPIAGGTPVYLLGKNFIKGATVTFAGTAATGISVLDSSAIFCYTPPHALGVVAVVVTNPDTQSSTLSPGFTYVEANPVILALIPGEGTNAGGDTIRVHGTGLKSTIQITMGHVHQGVNPPTPPAYFAENALTTTFVDANNATVITPAHSKGTVDVEGKN